MPQRMSRTALVVLALGLSCACSRALSPVALEDAQIGVRARTALVNDPVLGVRPIEIAVDNGVVRLSGLVGSEAERQRAVDLVRSVDGVREVQSDLVIGGTTASETPAGIAPARTREPESFAGDDDERERRWLAIGLAISRSQPAGPDLNASTRVVPLVRIRPVGSGLGLSIDLGWFHADLSPDPAAGALGRLQIRPVMAGLEYTWRVERFSASLALVGGVAFNGLSRQERSTGPAWVIDVGNSIAWRPGASAWLDLGPRAAFNVSTGYVMTSPRIVVVEDGRASRRRLRGDAALVSAGLVYKLF
jgi:BON domain